MRWGFFAYLTLLLLMGCGAREQPLVISRKIPPRSELAPYRASKAVYDQGKTVALCDVLWVTPTVCTRYQNDLIVRGVTDTRCMQIGEETYAFYVLLAPSDRDLDIGFNDSYAYWAPLLEIAGVSYTPTRVEKVVLPKEYEYLFAVEAVRFRTAYYLTFTVPRKAQGTECALCLHATRYHFCVGFSSPS